MITADQVRDRMIREIYSQPLMDNAMRGIWCEYMIAEALGEDCKPVGAGWNAWDLQIGQSTDSYPKRIRIQVKNSARLQSWNAESGQESDCLFKLAYRRRPSYFVRDNADIPCEEAGFLCDLYILCWHDRGKKQAPNHLDPSQWKFFLLPVVEPNSAVTDEELRWAQEKFQRTGKTVELQRKPETLPKGIRNRPPIEPISIAELTMGTVRQVLGLIDIPFQT